MKREAAFVERVPTYDELNWPSLVALKESGGSATIEEHVSKVIDLFDVPENVASVPHGETGRTELEYRLAWSRTALRRGGFIENSGRGVWALTERGEQASEADVRSAIAALRAADIQRHKLAAEVRSQATDNGFPDEQTDWKSELLTALKQMTPDAFERLSKRILRESGFTKVEVTGRPGDGGIDGTGILQLSLMSFPVLFQCKRYQGTVGPREVRDFRGAMMGRTDKGLIITTGSFSNEARKEATRDGAPPIELIDGDQLCEHLKKLTLGVSVELIESVHIHPEFFEQI